MISKQKLSVLAIFWFAGVLASILSLGGFRLASIVVVGDRLWGHWYYPTLFEEAFLLWGELVSAALLVSMFYVAAGLLSFRIRGLPTVKLKGIGGIVGSIFLFALNPTLFVGAFMFIESTRWDYVGTGMPVPVAFQVIGFVSGVTLFLMPRFVFLGYALRMATDRTPNIGLKSFALGFAGYILLAGVFGVLWWALVLTIPEGSSGIWSLLEHLKDAYRRTGFLARMAFYDGTGLSFILWYWLMFPEGFRSQRTASAAAATA